MTVSRSEADLPAVAVIVPVYGEVEAPPELIRALCCQDYPAELVDVVLVDNHPQPMIRPGDPAVWRLIHEARPGSYSARNAGAAATTAEVLAFTDADCVPRPDWLREGVSTLLAEPKRIVGGAILVTTTAEPSVAEILESRYSLTQEQYVAQGYAATANLFITRHDLEALGGFDEHFMSGGDRDLGYRATSAGLVYHFASRATVEHRARTTVAAILTKTRRVTAGASEVARIHGGRTGMLLHLRRAARPPVRRVTRLFADSELDPVVRLQLVAVSLYVWAVDLWSTLRRVLPGSLPPPRS